MTGYFYSSLLGFLVASILFVTTSVLIAWVGPTMTPPGGNVSAPINASTTSQIKAGSLGVGGLAVYGNAIISTVSGYLNFGSVTGSSGYGIRDNAGVMEFKNNTGSWQMIAAPTTTATTGSVGGGCLGNGTGWGNAINCGVNQCTNSAAGTCPTGYTAQKVIVTATQKCTGGTEGGSSCSCGSYTSNCPTRMASTGQVVGSHPCTLYYSSYYTVPTLCIKN